MANRLNRYMLLSVEDEIDVESNMDAGVSVVEENEIN